MPKPSRVLTPLPQDIRLGRVPDPCAVIIFGASGDLTRRKLVPAWFKLCRHKLLPSGFSIVGVARKPQTHDIFRENMYAAIKASSDEPVDNECWNFFSQGLFYFSGDVENRSTYDELTQFLNQVEGEQSLPGNRLFYLAVSPEHYPVIVENLGQSGLSKPKTEKTWSRIIIEKPFGRDLTSARSLNDNVSKYYKEDQIYRIDHYLGKETVQNILVFRFANSIFEPIWNHHYIDNVQITAVENIGIEDRGSYYDQAGALRDMVQNHMLQLVCTTAMEPPASFTARAVRDEKAKVLEAVRPISPEKVDQHTVRGQYAEGYVGGESAQAYRKEKDVSPDSRTETYTALKLFIDNWRWANVPFYLRTGKRLPKRLTEIAIQFKRTPHLVFARTPQDQVLSNLLVLGIQPDEAIEIQFEAKYPGPVIRLRSVDMKFQYGTSFAMPTEEAYERLLLDSLLGDATLFARVDWIDLAWSFITPVLEGWQKDSSSPIPAYAAGTWGPREADVFLARDNRKWRV